MQLFPHQSKALDETKDFNRVAYYLDMGLGKTLDMAVKQIQTGDTNTVFATGEGSSTPEQRLNSFLNYLLTYGRDQFSCYRKIRW